MTQVDLTFHIFGVPAKADRTMKRIHPIPSLLRMLSGTSHTFLYRLH
jgi:hypothetical protein